VGPYSGGFSPLPWIKLTNPMGMASEDLLRENRLVLLPWNLQPEYPNIRNGMAYWRTRPIL